MNAAKRWWLVPLLLGVCSALFAQSVQPVPPFSARVVDLTNTLTAQQRGALEQKLAAFQERKGSQVAVLVVATTEPESIEQFATRVFDQWKPGRGKVDGKWVDDGVILLVAKNDRRMRLEVGYGLEGALPDITARRIIDETIAPLFRQGDFYGGINAGLTRTIGVINGEPLPPPPARAQSDDSHDNRLESLLFIGVILVFIVGGIVRAIFGRTLGSGIIGALGGIAGWTVLGSLAAAIVVGIIAAVLSLMGGMAGSRRGGWYSPGGWGGGWTSGGGWGGGGGGSWSGGGGDFGGGGASSRW